MRITDNHPRPRASLSAFGMSVQLWSSLSFLLQQLSFTFLLLTIISGSDSSSVPAVNVQVVHGLSLSPLKIVQRDFEALTRRVTAYHILLPKSDEVALKLKQNLRNKSSSTYKYNNKNDNKNANAFKSSKSKSNALGLDSKEFKISSTSISISTSVSEDQQQDENENNNNDNNTNKMYIVDAFRQAAKKYSRCPDTAQNGGQLGVKVPQGYCRAPELDRACFEVPLGEICGPIESAYGYHLVLVEERTNCPKLDGPYTKIVPGGSNGDDGDGTEVLFVGPGYNKGIVSRNSNNKSNSNINNSNSDDDDGNIVSMLVQQIGFWIGISFAGGIVAEIAAKAAGVFETVPWE